MKVEDEYIESEEDYHKRVLAHYELVRQYTVKELSKSPLHQARAAKDPDYWKTLSPGCWNIPGVESPVRHKRPNEAAKRKIIESYFEGKITRTVALKNGGYTLYRELLLDAKRLSIPLPRLPNDEIKNMSNEISRILDEDDAK